MKYFSFLFLFFIALSPLQAAPIQVPAELESLPVQEKGRKKPFYTFATETLQLLRHSGSFQQNGEKWNAMQVMLGIWLEPKEWAKKPMIRINFQDLKKQAGLDVFVRDFSYETLEQNGTLQRMIGEVEMIRRQDSRAKLNPLQTAVREVGEQLHIFEFLISGDSFRVLPLQHQWNTLREDPVLSENFRNIYSEMQAAWQSNNVSTLQQAIKKLRQEIDTLQVSDYPNAQEMKIEVLYMRYHPFRLAWICYLIAALSLVLTSLWKPRAGYIAGWTFALLGFIFQFTAFATRIYISGRPPVTNMYETVIWISFGTMFFALIFEAIYRCRYFLQAATPVAVVALILADSQPMILDPSIHPLVPVLRNNFWLTIHVLTITLSYAAFALALGVAHIILGKICFQKGKYSLTSLYLYLYRTLQIGVLLLASGTILGGVWANYSWGRFWDWDPKETWALIALLCYLAVLHGRLAGWWGGFGLAVGAIICFQAIIMAWYGVNFILGVGLHSYGFGTGGRGFVFTFVALECLFVAWALWQHRKVQFS